MYAGRTGPQREATAGGLRGAEEKPALKEGEKYADVFTAPGENKRASCARNTPNRNAKSSVVTVCGRMHFF